MEITEKTSNAVTEITNYVNSTSRHEDFNLSMQSQHRTLQQSFTKLCLAWVEHVASDNYRTDPRNEASKEICQRIMLLWKADIAKEEKNLHIIDLSVPSKFLPCI